MGQNENLCLAHSHVQAVLRSVHALQLLKVFPGISNVDESGSRCWERKKTVWFGWCFIVLHNQQSKTYSLLLTNRWIRHNNHDVSVGGEDVDEGRKVGVPHFHALERGCKFAGIIQGVGKKRNRIKIYVHIYIALRGDVNILWTEPTYNWVWTVWLCYWSSQIGEHRAALCTDSGRWPAFTEQHKQTNFDEPILIASSHYCASGCSHQESGSLKQKHFICLDDLCKIPQVCLQLLDIGDKLVHYAGPGLWRQDWK